MSKKKVKNPDLQADAQKFINILETCRELPVNLVPGVCFGSFEFLSNKDLAIFPHSQQILWSLKTPQT